MTSASNVMALVRADLASVVGKRRYVLYEITHPQAEGVVVPAGGCMPSSGTPRAGSAPRTGRLSASLKASGWAPPHPAWRWRC